MHNKTIIGYVFHMIAIIIKASISLCNPPQPSASADNTNFGLDNYRYHAQRHPILVNCYASLHCT